MTINKFEIQSGASIAGDLSALNEESAILQIQFNSKQGEISSLQGQISNTQGQLNYYQNIVNSGPGNPAYAAAVSALSSLSQQLADQQGQLSVFVGQLSTLQSQIETVYFKMSNARGSISINPDTSSIDLSVNDVANWSFDIDGNLIPSSKTLDSHVAFQTQNNPTLQLGQHGQNVTITQAPNNTDSRGNNAIRIQGQRGYGTYSTSGDGGYGGNIQIYGGLGGETGDRSIASGGEGGYVEIFGGDGQHGRSGGYLFLQAGDARMSDGSQNYVHGGDVSINAGSAVDSLGTGLGTGGSVNIAAGQGNAADQNGRIQLITTGGNWQFTQTGEFKNNNTYTKTLETDLQGQSVTQVVWTSIENWISGAKLLIQLETEEIGDTTGWHSQVCEAIIASRGYANGTNGYGEPAMTVYGVTHTSSVPLVTFTVQRNPTTKKIEVVATRTAAVALSSSANLRVYSVETSTRD